MQLVVMMRMYFQEVHFVCGLCRTSLVYPSLFNRAFLRRPLKMLISLLEEVVFVCPYVRTFAHSHFCTFVRSYTRSFVHSYVFHVRSFVRSFVCLLVFPRRNQCSNVFLNLVYESILIDWNE